MEEINKNNKFYSVYNRVLNIIIFFVSFYLINLITGKFEYAIIGGLIILTIAIFIKKKKELSDYRNK